jgi:hypothetical protein
MLPEIPEFCCFVRIREFIADIARASALRVQSATQINFACAAEKSPQRKRLANSCIFDETRDNRAISADVSYPLAVTVAIVNVRCDNFHKTFNTSLKFYPNLDSPPADPA